MQELFFGQGIAHSILLLALTIGSHVSLYNNINYGSIYDETMEEYLLQ